MWMLQFFPGQRLTQRKQAARNICYSEKSGGMGAVSFEECRSAAGLETALILPPNRPKEEEERYQAATKYL